MKNDVTQAEFSAIVSQILSSRGDVASYGVSERGIRVNIFSRLRREKTQIFFDFDDGGKITGRFSYAQTNNISVLPQLLGNEIAEKIRQLHS